MGKAKTEKALDELQLADAGDAAELQAVVPEEEADQHAEQTDIAEPGQGLWTTVQQLIETEIKRQPAPDQEARHHRQGQQQRPADDLPGTQTTRQPRAPGIAKTANGNGNQHIDIG